MSRGVIEVWHLDLAALGLAVGATVVRAPALSPEARSAVLPAAAVLATAATPDVSLAVAGLMAAAVALSAPPGRWGLLGRASTAAAAAAAGLPALVAATFAVGAVGVRPVPAPRRTASWAALGLAAVAVWAQVPDTEVIVVVGAAMAGALASRPSAPPPVAPLAVAVLWAAAVGAIGRPAASVGVWAVTALLVAVTWWPARPVPTDWRATLVPLAAPAAVVLLAARTIGLSTEPRVGWGLVAAAVTAVSYRVRARGRPARADAGTRPG